MTTSDGDDGDRIGLDDAYAVEGPEGSRRLYAAWAATYDTDFVTATGYVYHRLVAELFCDGFLDSGDPTGAGPVLDVGCGTGVVGAELRRLGVPTVDGVDISPEMLDRARARSEAGAPVYRRLVEADLTTRVDIASDAYAGVVSAGTFTHGHLGPEALAQLFRVAAPGARCAIGINSAHFEELGFRARLDRFRDEGVTGAYDVVSAPIYEGATGDDPNQVAAVVVLTVV